MEFPTKERGEGKGGAFRIEQNNRIPSQRQGDCATLDRYGSLAECVECVICAGAYISFGRTTDGGATLIRVLDGDSKLSSYCHTHAEFMEAMEALRLRYKRGIANLTLVPPTQPTKSK
jgi:hypothetical protein